MRMLYDIDTTLAQECPAVCAPNDLGRGSLWQQP